MSEKELDALVEELSKDSLELHNFINNTRDDLDDDEIDELVEELQGSTLDLREFVIQALAD